MVLLPEDAAMTLAELRQMAARQQHQIEAQQQLLVAKEQRLKFLKQQEARQHNLAEHQLDPACLQNLRDKIDTQEHKLRQLRALRGQVEQQKTNNENLGTELDSIRALFCEKEKELNLAVSKVDELTRQLDEIRNNKNRKNFIISSSATELENLKRELMYRTKLSEQQNNHICQQREDIALRQQDIAILDKKINELTQRLHRKRLLNEQLASQIHSVALSRNYNGSNFNNGFYHATNVVAVEPLPRETLESEHTRDDMSAKLHGSHKGDLGEFGLNKNDPKYQTLPYNTKFTLKANYRERLLYYQCVPRYHQSKDAKNESSVKSKIATYFQKSVINKDSSSQQEHQKKEPAESTEMPKRKSTIGQLPIKPKPLTIRKTPGLEPPKLKVQPVINTNFHRKSSDSNLASHLKVSYLPQQPEETLPVKALKSLESNNKEGTVPVLEVAPLKKEDLSEQLNAKAEVANWVEEDSPVGNKEENVENCDEPDFSESQASAEKNWYEIIETTAENESDDEKIHSAALRRMRKGNLKGENSSRNCRRVSFDPLALLLDAALEGELELVKKTAGEVPNPSAANDEGITALHNAICAGHVDVVTFLVEFGCDVNAQDSDGWTPLHCAASCNNLPMVKFLVERGACIFATTLSDHETAAEKCEEDEEGFDGCSEYLYSLQENLGVMNNGIVYAVYDYEGQNADELSFKDGDMLTVLRKGDDEESEWWWSRLLDEEGYVPRNLLG
ncbi:apoptosis-stimulating of p53 protein 1 [Caerostris extrusa]|uniref:Apoptosis-stimulating of p53 protein 1 n=1 Tax=Caerostris extrusa TaxID=172846 RepID=A0AAV4NDI8_CAEEX|nr:apoptosis-stimulating of p53 protein 1 [Caerostris extrusa]